MKECKFERKRSVITDVETGVTHKYESVNKAKKASRRLQPVLGDGTLRLI